MKVETEGRKGGRREAGGRTCRWKKREGGRERERKKKLMDECINGRGYSTWMLVKR